MITIVYEVDCHCGGTATSATLALDQPEDDGRVYIDLEMSTSQLYLYCEECGCRTGTGDLELYNPDEASCTGAEDDGDEEEEEG